MTRVAEAFWQDVRYACRILRRNPIVTVVAILTLSVGIGLTTAVFSVVNAVLLRPLPYADGQRIVIVQETFRQNPGNASPGHFRDWTEQGTVFEQIAAGQGATFNLADGDDPERVRGMRVTPGYFRVAYIPPTVGRYFTQEDLKFDERVVVLSHSLWRSRFSGDPSVVGRRIRIGDELFSVIGVAPDAYALTDPARAGVTGGFSSQVWTPLVFSPEQQANFGSHYLTVIAKLNPGVSLERAREQLEQVTRGIAERHPQQTEARGVVLQPLQEQLVGNIRAQLYVLAAAVGFVLLIGCGNIAGLLIAKATTRRREIAIRASLGGGQPRIVRQLLTESLVLALAGGAAGLVVARVAINVLVTNGPETLPRLRDAGLQSDVLLFALAITSVAAFISGLAPALHAARVDLQSSLRETGKTTLTDGTRDQVRTVMVVAEIAIAVVLLIGCGLLLRSADRLRQVPLGFDAHNVLTARVALPAGRYESDEMVIDTYRRILAPLRESEGVTYAAGSSHIPLSGGSADASTVAEGKSLPLGSAPSPAIRLVTDEYFEAMGMRIVSGRSLQASDMRSGTSRVVVINERLAAALWPGETAVGKRLSTWAGPDDPEWREVVGIVQDVRSFGQSSPISMELFIPFTQPPFGAWTAFQRSMVLTMRTGEGWPENYVPLIRRTVREVDSSLPVSDLRTMESLVVASTESRRFYMRLVLIMAVTGLGLAMLGIYGVIAYLVAQRTPEIGLRLAIGAERHEVVRMVIARSLRTTLLGISIGVGAALLLTRAMATQLYEIKPNDPTTFISVSALVILTGLLAALVPCVKAAGVDPVVALRYD